MWDARQSRGRGPTLSTLPHAGYHPPPPVPHYVQNDKQSPAARAPGARMLAACFFSLGTRSRQGHAFAPSEDRSKSRPCGIFLAGTHASHNVTLAFRLPHVNLNLLSPLALLPTSPLPQALPCFQSSRRSLFVAETERPNSGITHLADLLPSR